MALEFTANYLEDAGSLFRMYRKLAEAAMAQVGDEAFFTVISPESNAIAAIVKHLAGNMRSRWTEFLTSDGEKPWRDRDAEFVIGPADTRAALMEHWQEAWQVLFATLESLTEADLGRAVTIRGERHSVLQAIQRQLTHYAYHSGQIVLLARHLSPPQAWTTLSVPRGRSAEFTRRVLSGEASQR